MTRKDFLLISGAIHAAKLRIEADNRLTAIGVVTQRRGVARTAAHVCDALSSTCGVRFDAQRFLTNCGFGADPVRRDTTGAELLPDGSRRSPK